MTYKLFIDDERFPQDDTWEIVRTVEQAKAIVLLRGLPTVMSLDHDLGGDETTMQFLLWLTDNYLLECPPDYIIHSQNPVGRENMRAYMELWKKVYEQNLPT
jgi:hypothetical protein